MAKKLLTLRIDEGLLGRVDERRGVLGQTRTLFVSRALEAALGGPVPGDTPRRGIQSAKESGHVTETAPTEDLASPQGSKVYSCSKSSCMFVSDSPGVCVHHRTERLR